MGCDAACGRSTFTPCVSSGAEIMKMMSSTSITSMYGTTLISAMRRLRCRGPGVMTCVSVFRSSHTSRARLPLQHRGKFLQEVVIAIDDAVELGRVAVVRDHCGDGGEEAHRGGDEGRGGAGRGGRRARRGGGRGRAGRGRGAPRRAGRARGGARRAGGGGGRRGQ